MTVAEATRLYQACLEELRGNPEDDELVVELERAKTDMEVAWLEQAAGRTGYSHSLDES